MATRLRKLAIIKVDLVDKGAAVGARVTLFKALAPQSTTSVAKAAGVTMTLQEILAALPEDQRKVLELALAEAAKGAAPAAKADEPKPEEVKKPEEALKRLPEDLRKALEAERASDREATAIAKKQADEARAEIAKMRDEQLDRECVAKASTLKVGAIGLAEKELGAIFKALTKGEALSTELSKKLEQHFVAVEAAMRKSELFKEYGANREGDASAQAQLQTIAKSLKEKDPTLSDASAMNRAYELNPALYAEVRNGKGGN